jgi:hypothetical protein
MFSLVLPYPGVVMPETLFSRFASQWYCPTAIDTPNLNPYKNHNVVIVGDPRSFGANLNDPKGEKVNGELITAEPFIDVECSADCNGLRFIVAVLFLLRRHPCWRWATGVYCAASWAKGDGS